MTEKCLSEIHVDDADDIIDGMRAIEGAIADLAARTNRPQGYPFSKITVYSTTPLLEGFMRHVCHVPASNLPSMKRLDFKKAGKVFGAKVQEMKNDLSKVPDEYLIIAERFDVVDEPIRKTTGCRKYLVEVECEDQEERWLVIQFRKAIKKYVTEDLGLNIVPPVFGDKYPEENPICIPRVIIALGDCKESPYQALTKRDSRFAYPFRSDDYGTQEFAEYPIRLEVATRKEIYDRVLVRPRWDHAIKLGNDLVRFDVFTSFSPKDRTRIPPPSASEDQHSSPHLHSTSEEAAPEPAHALPDSPPVEA